MSAEDARKIFEAGCDAVKPGRFMPRFIRRSGTGFRLGEQVYERSVFHKIYLLSMGKASVAMALELQAVMGDLVDEGIVVTKAGHVLPGLQWPVIEAGHPVPDGESIRAGKAITEMVSKAGEKDLLIVLVSGGASALVADLPEKSSLDMLQDLFKSLLHCGASIEEMNTVRKHFSRIKGGQLARLAFPARIHQFVLSDVPGDDLSVIASGPFYPDGTGFADCNRILQKYALAEQLALPLKQSLEAGLQNKIPDTPKPGDPIFENIFHHLVATNAIAMQAAAAQASALGYHVEQIGKQLSGEISQTAVSLLRDIMIKEHSAPTCYIAGGETTVTIKNDTAGKGGRNQEFVLSALQFLLREEYEGRLVGWPVVLSGGTDGSDGPTDATGAVLDGNLVKTMKSLQLDPAPFLAAHDAWHFFHATGGLIVTGPTQTNVMDLVVILIHTTR
ncbi:glycerate kinase [Flavihumibacter stibioxidans]|uniref:Glycerate kinase n=1 Tax=Flavihumibacter stibioxidans TaxID=1834163 RepID=A0ABR7M6Q6_9BACT|nr:DUF4147 domain-containing protein [Flavihumibacter stibioxidans]MBC6490730.1 hypothetical protein [Flavihumibacter stibioxidans]